MHLPYQTGAIPMHLTHEAEAEAERIGAAQVTQAARLLRRWWPELSEMKARHLAGLLAEVFGR